MVCPPSIRGERVKLLIPRQFVQNSQTHALRGRLIEANGAASERGAARLAH